MSKAKTDGIKLIANNKKARHDYFVEDSFEAGIVLQSSSPWDGKIYGFWFHAGHDEKYHSASPGYVVCRKAL